MQTTIGRSVRITGIGLHTGCQVSLQLQPAPEDTGIVFRRVDLQNFEIEALRERVSRLVLATTLTKRGVTLWTVEHVLSALYGLGLSNLYIDIDSLEVPILDGSAGPFVESVLEAGIREQSKERNFLKIQQSFSLKQGDKLISIEPSSTFRITYEIDFTHPLIGYQSLDVEITPESYSREIAFARTFGFYAEVEDMLKKGLIRGGSFENAVVLSETSIMNGELRAPDEFVRHKILDLIGDVSLCGFPLIGHIRARKAGHALHTDLATALTRNPKLCSKVTESELISQVSNF